MDLRFILTSSFTFCRVEAIKRPRTLEGVHGSRVRKVLKNLLAHKKWLRISEIDYDASLFQLVGRKIGFVVELWGLSD
jgi:hypothetical protein